MSVINDDVSNPQNTFEMGKQCRWKKERETPLRKTANQASQKATHNNQRILSTQNTQKLGSLNSGAIHLTSPPPCHPQYFPTCNPSYTHPTTQPTSPISSSAQGVLPTHPPDWPFPSRYLRPAPPPSHSVPTQTRDNPRDSNQKLALFQSILPN